MEETFIVLMIRDEKTGFLTKELNSYKILENENYIVNMYASEKDNRNDYVIHLKVSLPQEITDWQFDAIYDFYDSSLFKDLLIDISEVNDCYNPTWDFVFDYSENDDETLSRIKNLLEIHVKEITDVLEEIKLHEDEYK